MLPARTEIIKSAVCRKRMSSNALASGVFPFRLKGRSRITRAYEGVHVQMPEDIYTARFSSWVVNNESRYCICKA